MGILARQARVLELRPVGWAFVSLLPLSSGEKVAARPDEGGVPRAAPQCNPPLRHPPTASPVVAPLHPSVPPPAGSAHLA